MALDVYAGTLTRYYSRQWENVVERQAKLDGIAYTRIGPDADAKPPSPEQVTPAVANWCAELTQALGDNIAEPLGWDESESRPYFTDRPGWQGYSGLLVWAAYAHAPQLPRPRTVPESWADDQAVAAALGADSGLRFRQVLQPNLWLPSGFDLVFEGPAITGNETYIGSTFALRAQLNALNDATFRASREELSQFLREEFEATDELEHAAKFTLALFLELSERACAERLPLLLDF